MIKLIPAVLFLPLIVFTELSYSEPLWFPANRDKTKKRLESEKQQREALENQNTVTVDPTLKSASDNALCFNANQIELVGISVSAFKDNVLSPLGD
nr:hypothetical protein [Providencia sp. 21OH12SH02B-Prov]